MIIRIIMGFLGSLAFGIIFNVRNKFLILASFGGLLTIFGYEILVSSGISEMLACFIISAAITLYSEILARIVKTPTTTFIMTSLIPLIPGGALYYTMSNALEKKWELFFQNAYYALKIALALAVGIIVTTTLFQLFYLLVSSFKHKTY